MRVKISLKAKFFILLLFVLTVGGAALYFITENQISSFMLKRIEDDFSSHVNIHAQEYFDLSKQVSLKMNDKYIDYAKRVDTISGTDDVKVLDSNGIIIYSGKQRRSWANSNRHHLRQRRPYG